MSKHIICLLKFFFMTFSALKINDKEDPIFSSAPGPIQSKFPGLGQVRPIFQYSRTRNESRSFHITSGVIKIYHNKQKK